MGLKNSSITRVRPVFQQLMQKDPTGGTWLADLLDLAPRKPKSPSEVIITPGLLLKEISQTRPYSDRILQGYGVVQPIPLESCFEKSLPPPSEFLRWLILNLGELIYPDDKRLEDLTGDRKALFCNVSPEVRQTSTDAALEALNSQGAKGSFRQWWAFEGFTEVDCYLETNKLILLIEGKRTESLSAATLWYRKRNQIIRNLEVAAEIAEQERKEFAVLLIAEDVIDFDLADKLMKGLPHMDDGARQKLGEHFLGCITWQSVCDRTGLDFQMLPNTSEEVARQLLGRV